MKKIVLLLLVLAMVVTLFAGCTNDNGKNDVTTETNAVTTGDNSDNNNNKVALRELPNKKFQTNVQFLMRPQKSNQEDIFVDENSVNNIDQLVLERNDYVQELYGLEFELVTSSDQNGTGEFNEMLAGDRYDIIVPHGRYASTYVQQGCVIDLNQLPYLNLSYDWWQQKIVENFTVNGKLYYLTGDLAHTGIFSSYCLMYNRDIINDIDGAVTPYQYVKNNAWNWTNFSNLAKQCVIDMDGSGASFDSATDQLGWGTHPWGGTYCTFFASNNQILKNDDDGVPYFAFATESAYNAMVAYFDLLSLDGFLLSDANADTRIGTAMAAGRLAFIDTTIGEIVAQYAKSDLDYGIVPFPKVDETMDHYTSHVAGAYNMFLVSYTAGNFEATAVTLEALSQEGNKTVAPAYYDYASIRGSRDEDNYEMVLLIDKSRFYDFGYFWNPFGTLSSYFANLALTHSADTFYSTYQGLVQSGDAQKALDDFTDLFS